MESAGKIMLKIAQHWTKLWARVCHFSLPHYKRRKSLITNR